MDAYSNKRNNIPTLILLVGDILAFLLFVVLGWLEHRYELTLLFVLLKAFPLYSAWLIIAKLLKSYQLNSLDSYKQVIWSALKTWLIAAPLAVIIRWIVNQGLPGSLVEYILVVFGINLMLLIGWRLLFVFVYRKINIK